MPIVQNKFFFNFSINTSQEIKIGKYKTVTNSNFNKSKSLKILIHGFMGECAGENFPGTLINGKYKLL